MQDLTEALSASELTDVGSSEYNRIVQFLFKEALLLDNDRFEEWHATLAPDLTYVAPIRVTRARGDKIADVSDKSFHYLDDYKSMTTRVHRLTRTSSAWSDDPPIRYRRLVSNILVQETEKKNEFSVTSYLVVARNRFEWHEYKWITAQRNDILRKSPDGFQLAKREIILDMSVLGTPGLAVFL